MKRNIILYIFFVVVCSLCSVETYGHWWRMVVKGKGQDSLTFLRYNSTSCEAENGMKYYRITDLNFFNQEAGRYTDIQSKYGYRFADKKIYIYDFDSKTETVAFDFNLSVGNHFTTFNGMQWEVEAVKDTLVNVSECGLGECVSRRLLKVKALDGIITDQWLEDFGSFANHFMIRNMENVDFSHTLWMDYGDGEYLARQIWADPFYAHDSGWMNAHHDGTVDNVFARCYYDNGNVVYENIQWAWEHREYTCFYRKGNDIYRVDSEELSPMVDEGESALRKDSFSFVGLPVSESGNYTLHVGDDAYSTGVGRLVVSDKHAHGIFDMQGRPLPSKPTNGVYIMDGKKYCR